MADLKALEVEIKSLASDHLEKKLAKLKNRKWVLFPWLHYRGLLRRLHLIQGCCCSEPKAPSKAK